MSNIINISLNKPKKITPNKPAIVIPNLNKSNLLLILGSIYNLANIDKIINHSNEFIKTNNSDFNFQEKKENIEYLSIIKKIYDNFFFEEYLSTEFILNNKKYKEELYNLYYFPIDNELDDKYKNINYLENSIIEYFSKIFNTHELLINKDGKNKTLTHDEIKNQIQRLTYYKNNNNSLNVDFLFSQIKNKKINDSYKLDLFSLSFITMNIHSLQNILLIDNHKIYYELQQVNPLFFTNLIEMQNIIINFYIYMQSRNKFLTIENNIKTTELIIDFYKKIKMYPNLIKIFFNNLEKTKKDSFKINDNLQFIDNNSFEYFSQMLNINNID